jgi:putative aldouronate transport system permease protein
MRQPNGPTLVKKNPVLKVLRHWQLYLLVLLPMAAVIIFHYIPLYGVQIAFRDYSAKKGFFGSKWVGIKHFKRFFNYPKFWQIMWNTLKINLIGLITFPLPIMLAIMFNDLKNGWFKKTTQMLTYAPHFVSTVVLCSMVILFLNRETGVINVVIRLLGGEADDWMAKPEWFAPIYVLSGLW